MHTWVKHDLRTRLAMIAAVGSIDDVAAKLRKGHQDYIVVHDSGRQVLEEHGDINGGVEQQAGQSSIEDTLILVRIIASLTQEDYLRSEFLGNDFGGKTEG